MATQGDIVFMIGADVTGLTAAGQSGERSLADLEKAAKALDRQILKIGESGVAYQRQLNEIVGVQSGVARSARDSADAFAAFERSKAAVDALRASIDPVFAASKRYEAALVQLDSALEMGTMSASQHAAMVDRLAASYLRADAASEMLGTGARGIGGNLQNVGFQIQDFAVQVGAGASATQAFAQQFPQLASGFGPVGAVVGTLAAVGLPLLAMAFNSASDGASSLDEAMKGLAESSATAKDQLFMLQTGLDTMEQVRLARELGGLIAEQARLREQAVQEEGVAAQYLIDQADAMQGQIKAARERLATDRQIRAEIEAIQTSQQQRAAAEARLQQIAQASRAVAVQMLTTMQSLASTDISSPWQNVLSWVRQAAAGAQTYASALAYAQELQTTGQASGPDAARTRVQFGGGAFAPPVRGAGLPATPSTGGGGAGGGGGGENPLVAQVEALRNSLMSQEQLQLQAYQTQQQQLEQALEAQLVTRQEYAALAEAAQTKHQEAMSKIDVYRYGTGLQQAGAFMGDMASALQSGNEEMQRIARTFGAAEALINAWRASSQALADPSVPFFAKFAAASKVLAAGMGAVNAIKSGGRAASGTAGGAGVGMGSNSASGGAVAAPSPARPLEVRLTGPWANSLGGLLDQLNAEAGDRGYRLMVPR